MRSPGRRGNCRKLNGLGLKEWGFEVPAIPVGTRPRSWAQTPVPLSGAVEFRGGRGKVLGGPWPLILPPMLEGGGSPRQQCWGRGGRPGSLGPRSGSWCQAELDARPREGHRWPGILAI